MNAFTCTAQTPREKNAAAHASNAEFILFAGANRLCPGAQQALAKAVAAAPSTTAAFELRRFPCEHPKYYNPATCEAVWVCGDSVLVRRSAFLAVGGFDETVFTDIADIDLSWRLHAAGWGLLYVPAAGMQCAEEQGAAVSPEAAQIALAERVTGSLWLRLRFGTDADLADWYRLLHEMMGNVSTTPAMEQCFVQRMAIVKRHTKAARALYRNTVKESGFTLGCSGFDAAFLRAGEAFCTQLPQNRTEFTIIVRAYKRPGHLARTLASLHCQTYRHFCVIVVEDGEMPVCEAVCKAAAAQMPVRYHALRANAGRCEAGNTGLRLAKTDFVCFLDDDDYFFAEHLETMAAAIEQNPNCKLFFAGSLEAACEGGETLCVQRYWNNCKPCLTLVDFFEENPASIQAVVFHRSLFTRCGGLDAALDALEDWDLWLRFALCEPFIYIDKTTSLYRVPAAAREYAARAETFTQYRAMIQPRLSIYRKQAGLSTALEHEIGIAQGNHGGIDINAAAASSQSELAPLRASAQAVSTAKGWRWAAPLRALTNGTRPEWFGLSAPDFSNADKKTLNRFIFAARTSKFWQWFSRMR